MEPMGTGPAQPELTQRQRDILSIVVRTYTQTAVPVGSTTLASTDRLDVSSATIRNELAHLEELGYLTHPHTSAGRVPTEKGYRYFVAQLMQESELAIAEQRMIRHQFYQVRMNLEQWMRLTAAVLAHSARATSLVTAPQVTQTRLKYVKLISVSDMVSLIVLVLHGSTVRQEMLLLDSPMSQEELERVSNHLNELYRDMAAAEIETRNHALDATEQAALDKILEMMWSEDRHRGVRLYRDGLIEMLQQPEFSEPTRVRHLVQVLEEGSLAEPMLLSTRHSPGVQVIIGGEGQWEGMDGYGIVLSSYGALGRASGALGVLGPLRMPYHRAVSSVRYLSQLLTELVRDLYSE